MAKDPCGVEPKNKLAETAIEAKNKST